MPAFIAHGSVETDDTIEVEMTLADELQLTIIPRGVHPAASIRLTLADARMLTAYLMNKVP
jgi:hypothetical protein